MNHISDDDAELWRQNLDNDKDIDELPVIASTAATMAEHAIVYQITGCEIIDNNNTFMLKYSNNPSSTAGSHNFNSYGYCMLCGYPKDGVFNISSTQDYTDFLRFVNNQGGTMISAQLNADIKLGTSSDPWTKGGIGASEEKPFTGVFNGNGHTIELNTNTASGAERYLFNNIKNATIANLIVTGSHANVSTEYASGLVHYAQGDDTYLFNCISSVNIWAKNLSKDASFGGLVSVNNCKALHIDDCMYDGLMDLDSQTTHCAGFVGFNRADCAVDITNSLMAGTLQDKKDGDNSIYTFVRNDNNGSTVELDNSYYLNNWGNDAGKGTQTTTDEMKTGKLAALIGWGQKLDGTSAATPFLSDITHTRTFSGTNEWGMLCLPLSITVDEANDDYTLYKPVTVTEGENGQKVYTVVNYADSTTVPAGTPMFFKRNDTTQSEITFYCDDYSEYSDVKDNTSISGLTLTGTYLPKDGIYNIYTLNSSGNLEYVNFNTTLPACSAYMTTTLTSQPDMIIKIDDGGKGGTTSIANVNANANGKKIVKIVKNGRIMIGDYNIAGQRVK